MQRIFVVWDMSNSDIRLSLECLARRPPPGYLLEYPGRTQHSGSILENVVIPGIEGADRILD